MNDIILAGSSPPCVVADTDYLQSIWDTLGPNTKKLYFNAVKDFLRARGLTAREFFSLPHGEANRHAALWRQELMVRYAAKSAQSMIGALCGVCKRVRWMGRIDWQLQVEPIRVEKYRDTRGPGTDAVKAMLSACDDSPIGKRNRCIVTLLYALGLRRAELCRIDWPDHFDLVNGRLSIRGKGKDENNWVKLPDVAKSAVVNWLDVRGEEPGPLLVALSHQGRSRLTDHAVWEIVKRLGDKVGVHARPHGLRHSAITEALENSNGNIRDVAKFSRHAKIETVLIYDDNRRDVAGDISDTLANGLEVKCESK